MSAMLRREGLPPELAYIPLIESAYRTDAVSRSGAVGQWQLIAGTARRYGLRIDRYVDERRDPEKSTRAAARYLKDLHAMFGDWQLSLAAYNSGEAAIARLVTTHPMVGFWELSERGFLCAETRDFVPKFLAALEIAESSKVENVEDAVEQPMQYDTVRVGRPLSLSAVARVTGASTLAIRELNPALRRGVIPPRGYAVRVPKGTKLFFEAAYRELTAL